MKTSVILEKLRSFMRLSQTPVSAHMLVEQISQSLRLQPVVIATQAVAAVAILLYFWSVAFKPVLLSGRPRWLRCFGTGPTLSAALPGTTPGRLTSVSG